MNDNGTVRNVQDVINRAYGNQGTSSLDRAAATNVVATLRNAGWFSPEEVATLVRASGGKIEVTERDIREMGDYDLVVFTGDTGDKNVFTLQARKKKA